MNKNIKRIGLRFPEEVFEALDSKRWEEKLSFQALGEELFLGWLSDEKQVKFEINRPKRGPSSERYHDMLDLVLRDGDPEVIDSLKGLLKVFHEQILLRRETAAEDLGKSEPVIPSGKAGRKSV